jgi:quinol monooxygenase YgiN
MRTAMYLGFAGPFTALLFGLGACSSDDESTTPANTGTTTTTSTSTSAGGGGSGGSGGSDLLGEFVTVVKGTLAADVPTSKATHDAIAAGSETQAKAAGDQAHIPMLGTTHLGTTENEFFASDQWDNYTHMVAFYSDPQFQTAFGALFSAAPLVESFVRSDFYGWGDLDSGGTGTRYFIYVRGKLKGPTLAEAKAAHDAVAAGGEAQVTAAGDVAHVPYIGKDDPLEFLNFDIWSSDAAIDAVYTDPDFQAAFGALFSSPPTIAVYATSDWHAW